ncbi:hypothetical protein GEOBRER4_n1416 [Citrifermentans bremense]|uniref:Uncharacterized protein n=1 Tax=Citrifermentans bremense TaxID=60035 RepID=A0A7R7FS30_9BACT|nr:hypothetical protein GEOBRER4_n1416 [Citrifermentans bremense]
MSAASPEVNLPGVKPESVHEKPAPLSRNRSRFFQTRGHFSGKAFRFPWNASRLERRAFTSQKYTRIFCRPHALLQFTTPFDLQPRAGPAHLTSAVKKPDIIKIYIELAVSGARDAKAACFYTNCKECVFLTSRNSLQLSVGFFYNHDDLRLSPLVFSAPADTFKLQRPPNSPLISN